MRPVSAPVLAILALCALSPMAASANPVVAQVPVDATFGEEKLEWSGGVPPSYYWKMKLIAQNKRLLLCGVGAHTNAQFRSGNTQVLRAMSLTIDGKATLSDFTFFAKAATRRALDSATANCADAGPLPGRNAKIGFKTGRVSIRP